MATTARNQLRFITEEDKTAAEAQVRELQTDVDYETKEYTVELIVQKYQDGAAEDMNELFVPAYQRDFVWGIDRQSKFIESVMLGLPIPYVFTASLEKDIESDEGRVEIVDGSQRIRTLAAFLNDDLILDGLEKLHKLNGFRFSPDGHFKLPHLWSGKFPQAGRADYESAFSDTASLVAASLRR